MHRRTFSTSIVATLGLSGCLGEFETASLDQLVLDVAVTDQSSEDRPTRIRAELRNDGRGTVEFVTGPTIVPRRESGFGPVMLYPDTRIGNNRTPEYSSGCWRYNDDLLFVYDEAIGRELGEGDTYEETYSLYTVGEETECLPAGEYRFTDEITTPDETASVTLVVDVIIDDDGTVTATGKVADENSA